MLCHFEVSKKQREIDFAKEKQTNWFRRNKTVASV